jgi:1,2-diacylglycerol 3-alpha-glucosyltransferase
MRIVLMSDAYRPVINGVVNHIVLLKDWLQRWGEDVWLLAPGRAHPQDEANVVRYAGLPIGTTGYALGMPLDQRSQALLHSADIIHAHHPFASGLLGIWFAQPQGIPFVFTNHTRYDLYIHQYSKLIPRWLSRRVVAACYRPFSQRCSALIAPSQGAADVMRSWGANGRIVVIPNGVEVERFHTPTGAITRGALGLPENAVVAVFVGRMSGEKRVQQLLSIFQLVAAATDNSHLLLVGDGPEINDYRRMVNEMEMQQRVTFSGPVSYDQMPDHLAMSDFFVTASISEVHPLTIIEAMAAGLPVLGIRSPGVGDTIQHGHNGLLAAPDDEIGFVQSFVALVQNSEARRKMGMQAALSSNAYSAEENARSIHKLYQELVKT